MSHNIQTSLVVRGRQDLPPFRAISNNGVDAFAVGSDGYVYIYNVDVASASPTYSFLVLGVDGKVEYTSMFSTSTPGSSFDASASNTIGFSQTGVTYSFYIQPSSITASLLNTGTNGGATAGYFLSVNDDGNFEWSQVSPVITGDARYVPMFDSGSGLTSSVAYSVDSNYGRTASNGSSNPFPEALIVGGTKIGAPSNNNQTVAVIDNATSVNGLARYPQLSVIAGTAYPGGYTAGVASIATVVLDGVKNGRASLFYNYNDSIWGLSNTVSTGNNTFALFQGTKRVVSIFGGTNSVLFQNGGTHSYVPESFFNVVGTSSFTGGKVKIGEDSGVQFLGLTSGTATSTGQAIGVDDLGNVVTIPANTSTSLDVVDYITGETFSSVSTMIFRGGNVTVPVNATLAGATATGVSVTGPAPVVTVWIPAPNYVTYFNPTLYSAPYSRYVSTPTTNGYTSSVSSGYYGTGTWVTTTDFNASTARDVVNSSASISAFTETEFACYNNGTTMSFYVYNHDGSILSSIVGYVLNGAGSTTSNNITLTVNSFSTDNDRYKANVTGTINVGSLFPNGGRFNWKVVHNNGEGSGANNNGSVTAGVYEYTKVTPIFYDNDGTTSSAKISGGVAFDEQSATLVYYSGVAFYGIGSSFSFTASQIDLLNDITIPTTNQITLACTNLATSGSFAGYADGTKPGVGAAITGWTLDWNKSGLTYSRTLVVNTSSTYVPGFSTNNTISSSPVSYVTGTIYDYGSVGSSQSTSRTMLFDTYTPSSVTYANNPIDSENGRLSMTGVMSSGSSAFDSTLSLTSSNTDELQYIFGRVIYPQTNFTAFYPRVNWTASVNYSSLSGSNKTFTVYTNINTGTTTTLTLNDYRWHVTSYGKDAAYSTSFSNGVFTINSNFSESYLHYDGINSTAGTADLVIIVGFDDTSTNTTPNKFLFVSGDPVSYGTRQAPVTYNLNKSASSKDIQWSKGTLSPVVKKVWLFIGYKNSATGKNLNMTNIALA